jgi:predicted nucleic acid-binding protein
MTEFAPVPHAGRASRPCHRGPSAGGAVAPRRPLASTAPSIPDLLVAATAEKAGLTVLAADKDFTLIAVIRGQPIETLSD